jgi:hypothetical protein
MAVLDADGFTVRIRPEGDLTDGQTTGNVAND